MVSFIAALAAFALLCLPGWLCAMRVRANLGVTVAAGFGSLYLALLLAAALAETVGGLPAWSVLPIAALLAVAAAFAGRGGALHLPGISVWQLVFPAFCALVAFTAYSLGFQSGEDPYIFRSWYNADWFKHLAHAHSATNFGIPVPDIFANLERLHYYWLFYLLPGASASIHGDVQGALIATHVIIVFGFWLLLQETLRACGLTARAAAALAFAGWCINSITILALLQQYRFDLRRFFDDRTVDPGMLLEVNTYIPHHVAALCGLLSFALLIQARAGLPHRLILALAPVVAAGATSTLLGASIVAAACATLLFVAPFSFPRRALLAVGVGLLSLAVVFGLQVVVPDLAQGSLSSPVFDAGDVTEPRGRRILSFAMILLFSIGLVLGPGVTGLMAAWRSNTPRRRTMAIIGGMIFAIGLGATCAAAILLDDRRVAGELALRNQYLLVIGLLIGIALLVTHGQLAERLRRGSILLVAVAVILGSPAVALNLASFGLSGPKWQVAIPADDMRAMEFLAEHAPADAVILQSPELNFVQFKGPDTWVPIFAGRTIPASYRSTNWAISGPVVERMERFYDGDPAARPDADIDWIYLSRALHPESYEILESRLQTDAGWRKRLALDGASLFDRVRPADGEGGQREEDVAD